MPRDDGTLRTCGPRSWIPIKDYWLMAEMRGNFTPDEEMTLQERWPNLYQQLCEVRETVERHFRDACDLEFTVENGKLYILNVRRAKRTHVANLRIALQFYAEGKIGLVETVCGLETTQNKR